MLDLKTLIRTAEYYLPKKPSKMDEEIVIPAMLGHDMLVTLQAQQRQIESLKNAIFDGLEEVRKLYAILEMEDDD